jgi:hypothetical protein
MDDNGRWIRITRGLRESIEREARACTCGAAREAAALHVVGLYERARPEDWIGQLTEINRKLTEENSALRTSLRRVSPELHPESA